MVPSSVLCVGCGAEGLEARGDCPSCGRALVLQDRFVAVERLGQGASSHTYGIVSLEGGERYALKALRLEAIDDLRALELFERQHALLATLEHPGLPRVYEAFRGPKRRYLRQEWIEGETLQARIEGGQRHDEDSARELLGRLLDVLDYLHSLSPPILHRDIKPSNVMIRPDGSPVLIDFDTARGAGVDHAMADGTMVGSAGYVPPEQLAGRPVPASDLYALGMTMVVALSHRRAHEIPTSRMRPQFRSLINVSDALAEALQGMLEPVVEDRLQSVEAVRQALRAPFVPSTAQARPAPRPPQPPSAGGPAEQAVARYRALARRAAALSPDRLRRYELPGDTRTLDQLRVSDDGASLVVHTSGLDEPIRVIDTRTLRQVRCVAQPRIPQVALSADGAVALVGRFSDWTLHHLQPPRVGRSCPLQLTSRLSMALGSFGTGIALRRDGAVLAILSRGQGTLYDAQTGAQLQTFQVEGRSLPFLMARGLRFTPDGSALLIGLGHEGTIVLCADGSQHTIPSRALAISPDGQHAAIAEGGRVKLGVLRGLAPLAWGTPPRTAWIGEHDITQLRFSPGGSGLLAVDSRDRIVAIDAHAAEPVAFVTQPHLPGAPFSSVDSVGFLDEDRVVVVGRCVPAPGEEPRTCGALSSLSRRRGLGTIVARSGELVGITTAGRWAELEGSGKRAARVRRLLLGEPLEAVLEGEARERALELSDRIWAWSCAVADGLVLPSGLPEAIDASAGLAHLLPIAIARAGQPGQAGPARFGDVRPDGAAIPAEEILSELQQLGRLPPAEQQALLDEANPVISAAARAREEVPAVPAVPTVPGGGIFARALSWLTGRAR